MSIENDSRGGAAKVSSDPVRKLTPTRMRALLDELRALMTAAVHTPPSAESSPPEHGLHRQLLDKFADYGIPPLVRCDGEAHSNAFIDNCHACAPRWGWVEPSEKFGGARSIYTRPFSGPHYRERGEDGCVHCGRPCDLKSAEWTHVISGGADFATKDQSLLAHGLAADGADPGDMGCFPVGTECAAKLKAAGVYVFASLQGPPSDKVKP
jgi:hypothetical protein